MTTWTLRHMQTGWGEIPGGGDLVGGRETRNKAAHARGRSNDPFGSLLLTG
jgi:hypothetical protein